MTIFATNLNMLNMKKIELNEREIKVIKQHLKGNFDRVFAPDEDKEALMGVIKKAEELDEDLGYEEYDDMILWYWGKYKAQEGISK